MKRGAGTWTLLYKRTPRGMANVMKPAAQEALGEIGKRWHKEILPGHFTEKAPIVYHEVYTPRSRKYMFRKLRKWGHQKALVWSGALERTVRGSAMIRATHKSVRVTMRGPRWLAGYIAFKGRKSLATGMAGGPDKKAEITAVTRKEAESFARFFRAHTTEAMNRAQPA